MKYDLPKGTSDVESQTAAEGCKLYKAHQQEKNIFCIAVLIVILIGALFTFQFELAGGAKQKDPQYAPSYEDEACGEYRL